MLIGKSKAEVKLILGDPFNEHEDGEYWCYDLGLKPGLGIDPDMLVLRFQNGLVVEVEQNEG